MANPINGDGNMHQNLNKFPFVLAFIALILTAPAAAQNPHGKIHDTWGVRCNTPTGAPAACQIFQNIVVKDSRQPILNFAISFADDAKTAVGIFVMPLGIYLPPGLTLQVDDGQIYEMAIEICGLKGCRVRFGFDENLMNLFKRGKAARITFSGGDQKPIRIPVSLKGFTAALNDLK